MNSFMFDASALVKRYSSETGSTLVDSLLTSAARPRLFCLMLGAAEVAAALVRKRNSGHITTTVFAAAMRQLDLEVLASVGFRKLAATNALIYQSIPLSDVHAINATDAILLRAALDLAAQLRSAGDDLVLVASDHRLLNAAQAEGLVTFNPETQTQADLTALLAG